MGTRVVINYEGGTVDSFTTNYDMRMTMTTLEVAATQNTIARFPCDVMAKMVGAEVIRRSVITVFTQED